MSHKKKEKHHTLTKWKLKTRISWSYTSHLLKEPQQGEEHIILKPSHRLAQRLTDYSQRIMFNGFHQQSLELSAKSTATSTVALWWRKSALIIKYSLISLRIWHVFQMSEDNMTCWGSLAQAWRSMRFRGLLIINLWLVLIDVSTYDKRGERARISRHCSD